MVYKCKLIFLFAMTLAALSLPAQSDSVKKLRGIEGDKLVFDDGSSRELPALRFDAIRLFVLVRHAEQDTIGFDPGLSDAGNERAAQLARLLEPLDIGAVYATPFRRTKLTAFPVARAKELETGHYDPGHLEHFIEEVLSPAPHNALIVGHSNTTPLLINQWLGEDRYATIPETDYHFIFFMEKYPNGKLKVYRFSY